MHETRDERISRPNDGKREKGGEGERDGDRTRTFHILLGESQLKTCHAKVVRVRGIRISYIFLLPPPSNRHLARRAGAFGKEERGKRGLKVILCMEIFIGGSSVELSLPPAAQVSEV